MSNKIFLGAVVIVLIVAGYVIYANYYSKEAAPFSSVSVSFICEVGTDFIASFDPDMDRADILVAGRTERSLVNTRDESAPYTFSDNEYIYTFVGEEAVVANIGSGESYVCRQPFDPNGAPHNFGDAAMSAHQGQFDPAMVVSQNIVGRWRSLDDISSAREFRADGTMVEEYDEETLSIDTWIVFNGNAGIEAPFLQEDGAVYLQLTTADGTEMLYFEVSDLTTETLELTYLDRGGVLRYAYVGPRAD